MSPAPIWSFVPTDDEPAWPLEQGLPTIRVGPSDAPGWPAVHPGVFDASGGHRGHRVVVDFEIPPAQSNTGALLTLQGQAERGPCPDLEIVLDDTHRGLFHPGVLRRGRVDSREPGPVAGRIDLQVELPAAWLGAGRHTIAITTAVDHAAALGEEQPGATHDISYQPDEALPQARAHYGRWFGSYLRWSRVELTAVGRAAADGGVQVDVRPTPFYVNRDGSEVELVDVDVTWAAGTAPPLDIVLQWPLARTPLPAPPPGRDFGMFRTRMAAPELDGTTPVTVHGAGEPRRHQLVACRRWTLHLIPHVHLDLGFTDSQGKVLELHCRNIDRALDRFAVDPDFRFCVDGSVIAAEYARTRPSERVERMREAIAAGRLGVNAFHSNFLTGVVGLEELYRSTGVSLSLPCSQTTGMRYANLTDVPTYSRSIASVLADLGIDGFVGMSNHGRAATITSDELHLRSPVRWQGPDGREVLAHFADHYSQLRFMAADPQALAGAANGLDRYLSRYERPDYLPSDLAVIGTHADNEDLADGDTGFVHRWNAEFAWPRFRVSTFDEYLAAVAPLTDRLPCWRSESGSYWEDGVGSAAASFAVYRRAQALLGATETLGALVSAAGAAVRTNRTELDRAWADLSIAAEHTLTWARSPAHPHAAPVVDQLGWKTRYITDAHRVATDEMRRHLAQLGEHAGIVGPGFLFYNPHAWSADLDAEIDLAEGVDLLDAHGPVPVEVLTSCAGLRRVRVALPDLPGHSWRFLPVSSARLTVPGGDTAPQATAPAADSGNAFLRAPVSEEIVSRGWKVVLDPETQLPRSLRRRDDGRELLDGSTGAAASPRLGQILRAGATAFSPDEADALARPVDVHDHHRERTPAIEDFCPGDAPEPAELVLESPTMTYVGRKDTPGGTRLRWRGEGAGVSEVTVELLLRDDASVCDLDVSFTKAPCLDMEAVYVCFPFAGTEAVLRYDRPLGWVRPATDHGPGASNEWAAATNTVSLQSTEGEIRWTPLDAPLFAAGDIVRGRWPAEFPRRPSHLYSFAMNNFWPCNTPPWQSGPVTFSYRFGPADGFDPVASTRFGRTARLDAQACEILPLDHYRAGGPSPYRDGQLGLGLSQPELDVALRQGEDPRRPTLHLLNLSDRDLEVAAELPATLRAENQTGEPEQRVDLQVRPCGIAHVNLAHVNLAHVDLTHVPGR